MIIMIALNSLIRQKKVAQGEEKARDGMSKKGRTDTDRNSDIRRGRSHKSFLARGVGCEEQEKSWTVVLGSTPQEGCFEGATKK